MQDKNWYQQNHKKTYKGKRRKRLQKQAREYYHLNKEKIISKYNERKKLSYSEKIELIELKYRPMEAITA